MPLHLEPLHEDHLERLHALFDAICRERRFLAFTQAPPREQTFAYYRNILDGGHIHVVALDGETLAGWCDILPLLGQMRAHAGVLGIAVSAAWRGQGVGRRLIEAALARADERGLARVELTVHAENVAGQALYRSVGFELEGVLRNGWCLDGRFFDVQAMARLRLPAGAAGAAP
jgi:ribosomal protein S18 acetylase RimI-like enzyme